jgi:hypothetical protein
VIDHGTASFVAGASLADNATKAQVASPTVALTDCRPVNTAVASRHGECSTSLADVAPFSFAIETAETVHRTTGDWVRALDA